MIIKDALISAKKLLEQSNIASYNLDVVILLADILKKDKEFILFNPEVSLDQLQLQEFFDYIKRRANYEPVAKIINKKEFYNRDFYVNKDVLDPRPDSEILIETTLKYFDNNCDLEILELGLGSGCLSITLLNEFKNSKALGIDISKNAIKVAQKNRQSHNLNSRLKILESNLFDNLDQTLKFDLIISNPPYIKSNDINNLDKTVKNYDPLIALDGGEDGLDFYRQIAQNSPKFLKDKASIIVEIGQNQEQEIIEIFTKNNFKTISLNKDLSKIVRVIHFRA